jgi:hypothetical protein
MTKTVYIVHCIDTEGPMYESLEETFSRLVSIFDIQMAPTKENLRKLQHREIDLNGNETAVSNLLAPQRLAMNETWDQVDLMLDEIQSDKYRDSLKDSIGNGWVYSWFCLDHVGFSALNPRRRDAGYHNVFDHYRRRASSKTSDIIQWHYHPLPVTGNFNDSGTAYLNSNNIWEILSRKVIERQWFPSVYRPGFHTERPDSHWFLEQWIPFDYANQSMLYGVDDQPDLSNGRYGDWRRAPTEWMPYHPDHSDYQKRGNCQRWIARCLNMEARIRELSLDDVKDAFSQADDNGKSLLAFTNHDFRDMKPEIDKVKKYIESISKDFPQVEFQYVDALTGFRKMISEKPSYPELECSLTPCGSYMRLNVLSKGQIFGSQPFLAIKLVGDRYIWENFDFQEENAWSFTFDNNHIPFKYVEEIGVACNSPYGHTEIISIKQDGNQTKTTLG